MTFPFISTQEAIDSDDLVMTVVTAVPSPWGEAAKAILQIKEIDFKAVPFDPRDTDQATWTGVTNAPCLIKKGEINKTGWLDILLYAERTEPSPPLIPTDPMDRAFMLGFAHEIMGEEGLCWARRVQLIHMGLEEEAEGGFPAPLASSLAGKYGADVMDKATAEHRVIKLMTMIADRLISQESIGSPYLIGRSLTALDIYVATSMVLFAPLSDDQCAMHPRMRTAFETPPPPAVKALLPQLAEYRNQIYKDHMTLPVQLAPIVH